MMMGQNAIGGDKVVFDLAEIGHGLSSVLQIHWDAFSTSARRASLHWQNNCASPSARGWRALCLAALALMMGHGMGQNPRPKDNLVCNQLEPVRR